MSATAAVVAAGDGRARAARIDAAVATGCATAATLRASGAAAGVTAGDALVGCARPAVAAATGAIAVAALLPAFPL
jgi:hypothetical protein